MSAEARRVGPYVEIEFVGTEIIETYGKRDELYGDGVIVLSPNEAIKLAKELLEAVLEKTEEEEEKGETA
jgi:hypothetical protein